MSEATDISPPAPVDDLEDFVRIPGVFRRSEIEEVLCPGAGVHVEHAGAVLPGTDLFYVYRRLIGANEAPPRLSGRALQEPSLGELKARHREEHEHGDSPINVSVLAELCDRLDLMSLIRGDGSARSQQSRLGRALQGARDRVFGELQVVVGTEDRKKRTLYTLRRVEAEPDPIESSQPGAGMNEGGGGH